MLDFDLTFPHSYQVKEVGDSPGTGKFGIPVHYFAHTSAASETNGLWLRVVAGSGKTWIGVFAFGYSSALSKIISPDPARFCVVSKGNRYFVSAEKPELWEKIPLNPAVGVRPLLGQRFLVFSDFMRRAGYSVGGFAWQSPRLCWGG